ncbi:MAG: GldG family protein [Planctomycetota bacterium]|nr:GldG family protein [Planctomycetota bacterium]
MVLFSSLSTRWDFTRDKEYSLAPATRNLLTQLEDRLQLKLFLNKDLEGAEAILPSRLLLEDLLEEMVAWSGGKVSIETVDPTLDMAASSAAEAAGVRAIQVPASDGSGSRILNIWQGLEMRYQGRSEVIPFAVPAEFEFAFAVRLGNLIRESPPRVGFFSREPALPPSVPGMELPVPAGRIFDELRNIAGLRFGVTDVSPENPEELENLAALVVVPEAVTPEELAGIQNYLQNGGHVLVLFDRHRTEPSTMERTPIESGLEDWFAELGVYPSEQILWDEECFQIPTQPQIVELPDGRRAQVPQNVGYGLWPLLTSDSLAEAHVVVSALSSIHMLWAHPLILKDVPEDLTGETLFQSTQGAWLVPSDSSVEPTLENIEQLRAQAMGSGPSRSYPLAVALSGPKFSDEGLLVVLGDSDLLSNAGLALLPGGGNRDLAANLFDWLSQDASFIGLRSRGNDLPQIRNFFRESIETQGGVQPQYTRTEIEALESEARTFERGQRRLWAWGNVLIAPLLLLLLAAAHFSWHARRGRNPWRGERGSS